MLPLIKTSPLIVCVCFAISQNPMIHFCGFFALNWTLPWKLYCLFLCFSLNQNPTKNFILCVYLSPLIETLPQALLFVFIFFLDRNPTKNFTICVCVFFCLNRNPRLCSRFNYVISQLSYRFYELLWCLLLTLLMWALCNWFQVW